MQRFERTIRAVAARAPRVLGFGVACLILWSSVPGAGAATRSQPAESDTLEWLDDYQAALAQAKRTGRPLLVEFRCAP